MGAQLNLWPKKMGRYQLRNFSKTSNPPRRPFEKERLDAELKLIGQYGLKNKKEIWRVRMALSKIRATARVLLTKDEKDPVRIFEGQALMRRMIRYGILDEDKQVPHRPPHCMIAGASKQLEMGPRSV